MKKLDLAPMVSLRAALVSDELRPIRRIFGKQTETFNIVFVKISEGYQAFVCHNDKVLEPTAETVAQLAGTLAEMAHEVAIECNEIKI